MPLCDRLVIILKCSNAFNIARTLRIDGGYLAIPFWLCSPIDMDQSPPGNRNGYSLGLLIERLAYGLW